MLRLLLQNNTVFKSPTIDIICQTTVLGIKSGEEKQLLDISEQALMVVGVCPAEVGFGSSSSVPGALVFRL